MSGCEGRDGQEHEHVREVAVDQAVLNAPVPEVEHEHHQRAEERRKAGQHAEDQAETDREFTERDDHVDDREEPRGGTHPVEHAHQRVAIDGSDVEQVAARVKGP